MRNNHDSNRSVNDQVDDLNSGFCWGPETIGAVIDRNPRETHHLLTRGEIKCATFATPLTSMASRPLRSAQQGSYCKSGSLAVNFKGTSTS